jgi:hypothetical protein
MKRTALGALIVVSAYVTGTQPPDPALTRVAPDRAMPNQRVLSRGFWGASARLLLIGPDFDAFSGRRLGTGRPPYPMTTMFDVSTSDRADVRALAKDAARRGFLRMEPSLWYGVRPEVKDRLVPNGKAAQPGRYLLRKARRPTVPRGWRLSAENTEIVQLPVRWTFEGAPNGGAEFWLGEPNGWRLAEIGLTASQPYVASFNEAWKSPRSEWEGPKPSSSNRETSLEYRSRPTVWAQVTSATLVDERTGERRRTLTPTGWVEAASLFHRAHS